MKNQFESIKTNRFKTLQLNELSKVIGKERSGSGSFISSVEKRTTYNDDGTWNTQLRNVYLNYTSDEITADAKCYYGTTTTYGDWH